MNVIARIDEIMKKQGLTDYQLSKLSGLSPSTISNMRIRNTVPTIPTLQSICDSLNVSMSQFFTEEDSEFYPITRRQKEFFDLYVQLTDEQQDLLLQVSRQMQKGNQ